MTDEELKSKMEFIVEQQAQFSVDIEQLKSVVARLANSTLRRFEKNEAGINDLDAKMAALVDAQIATEAQARETRQQMQALAVMFERFISRENGKG